VTAEYLESPSLPLLLHYWEITVNKEIFREYDIRGLVETDLTDDVALNIGKALATYMTDRGKSKASVGRDCRLSSDHLVSLVIKGMLSSGISVVDLGIVPTPLFYYSLFNLDVEGGIMVTGSHNPPEYNGFKVAFEKSTLFSQEIQAIREIIEAKRFVTGSGTLSSYLTLKEDYYDYLRSNIVIKNRGIKVVVDAGNGTGGIVACPIMEEMGVEVIPLFCDMDGHFPNHFPDPTVESNLAKLREMVLKNSAAVGIGFDGDADRIGVIDEKGNVIWGDYLMLLFARDILTTQKGATFVSEVKCSKNLFRDIESRGGKAIMWKAGHSLIKQKMKEMNAVLGGEMSGHMFFADRFFGFDDAIYASLRLLEILGRDNTKLSDILSDVPPTWSTPEIRIDCPEQYKIEVVTRISDWYKDRFEIINIDGARIIMPDGWGLVRASNTQPILVLRFEADSHVSLERIKNEITGDLKTIMEKVIC
jgi:phosphomannomutase / phosphoglucomutase